MTKTEELQNAMNEVWARAKVKTVSNTQIERSFLLVLLMFQKLHGCIIVFWTTLNEPSCVTRIWLNIFVVLMKKMNIEFYMELSMFQRAVKSKDNDTYFVLYSLFHQRVRGYKFVYFPPILAPSPSPCIKVESQVLTLYLNFKIT